VLVLALLTVAFPLPTDGLCISCGGSCTCPVRALRGLVPRRSLFGVWLRAGSRRVARWPDPGDRRDRESAGRHHRLPTLA